MDPVSEVLDLEKKLNECLDSSYNNCVKKCLKRLEEFSGRRPSRKEKPSSLEAAGDLVSGEGEEETVEYDKNADAIQAEMNEALGGSSVEEIEAQTIKFLDDSDVYWRQHSLKIQMGMTNKALMKERDFAVQRNKDLKDLIKKTRKKATIIIQSAYDTKAMFEMAMAGKPFVENSGGGGKDAIWAEVFASQANQKEKAAEALKMMEDMNAQADECNAEMKKQTEKFNENIQAAEDVKEGLEAGMDKLKQLAGGMNPLKDPILCFLICLAVTTFAGSVCIIAGVW